VSREAFKGRITGKTSPLAETQKFLKRQRQNAANAEKREAMKRLSQEELLDILTPTREELLQAK
jgi:hypothetical protein